MPRASFYFIAFLCFAVGTESEEENRKRSKGSLGRGGVKNDSKTLPESSPNPPKMAPGSLPGSLRRHLGAIGCSWRLLGRSWRLWGRSWGSGGVPRTPRGVILASLGCFLQSRLKNHPRRLKNKHKNSIFKDRFATLFDVFVDPLSSRKLLGET